MEKPDFTKEEKIEKNYSKKSDSQLMEIIVCLYLYLEKNEWV